MAMQKKIKRYLRPEEIREAGIVSWSNKTFERKIKFEGLPCIKGVERGVLIDLDDLDNWMQQRKCYGDAS